MSQDPGSNPIQRRYTSALPAALGAITNVTDDITTQATNFTSLDNAVVDIINDPQPGAGVRYEIRLLIDDVDSGRAFFTDQLNPATEGRLKIVQINTTGLKVAGNSRIQWQVIQRAGALAATSFVVTYKRGFGAKG